MVETALKTKPQRRLRRASRTAACSDAAPFPPRPSASNLRVLGVKRQAELTAEGAELPRHPTASTAGCWQLREQAVKNGYAIIGNLKNPFVSNDISGNTIDMTQSPIHIQHLNHSKRFVTPERTEHIDVVRRISLKATRRKTRA